MQSCAALVVAFTTARMFVNTVFFDLGDVVGDRAEGVATIPVRFGFAATRTMLHVVNILIGVAVFALATLHVLPPVAHVMNVLTLYAGYYVSHAQTEASDLGFTCDVIADGEAFVGAAMSIAFVAAIG